MENKLPKYSSEHTNELNKLRMVFEQTPGAIFILDKEFRFEFVNPSFERLSGYKKEELLTKTVAELFYHTELHPSRRDVVETMLRGEKWQGELLTHTKNGSTYWANTIASPYKNENGTTEGYIVIQQDISDRKKMETALLESEAKYKTLVENSQDGIIIVRDNKVMFANDTICKLLGYCLEGLSAEEIIHPEDIHKVVSIAVRRRNQDFSTINETFRMIAKNGDIKECDTTSTLIQFGGIWASFFTIHDLTESNRMQHELRESEKKYRELTEMLPLTVYELNADNLPTYINKAGRELFGISNEKPQRNAMSFFVPTDRERMKIVLKNEQNSAENTVYDTDPAPSNPAEYSIQKPDGTTIPVLIYGTAIMENGKPSGSRGVIVDISERKAMENALRESEKKYRELADFLPQTVFELDIEGNLLYVNKSGVEIMGVSDDDIGQSVLRFFVPDDRKRMAENLTKRARENRPNAMNEYTALRNDGKKFPVIIYALSIQKEGNPVGTRGIIVDISEQKAMENALRESEAKYKTLIENSQDGVFAIEEDKILFANQTFCNLVGYSSEELYRKSAMSLVQADDRMRGIKISELRQKGDYSTKNDIFRFVAQDGTIKEVDVFSSVIELNNKKVSLITVHDLTEIKRAENELKAAKLELENLNSQLEKRVKDTSKRLTEARTQLISLQKENLQSQYEVLKQQVNPHFLFNSLNVLTSLIKIEPDLAEKFSEQLSKVYRYVLENKDYELVDINTELNFLEAYIFLLNIRFVGKLQVNVTIPADKRNERIIPLAMQLLIENAIKHNVMSKVNPLVIDIYIDNDNNLNIINNLQERPSQIVSTGVGLKNILNRYQLLNLTVPTFEKTNSHFTAKIKLIK